MQVSLHNKNVTITGEGENQLAIFEQLTRLQEVFGDLQCGKCKNDDVRLRLRKATDKKGKKEYIFPEAQCKSCWAKLTFGQMEGGGLFPVRFKREEGEYLKDENDNYIPRGNNGWVKYNKETGEEE